MALPVTPYWLASTDAVLFTWRCAQRQTKSWCATPPHTPRSTLRAPPHHTHIRTGSLHRARYMAIAASSVSLYLNRSPQPPSVSFLPHPTAPHRGVKENEHGELAAQREPQAGPRCYAATA